MNSYRADVVSLLYFGVVIELGDETPLVVDPAEQLDDELDDPTLACPNAVSQFAAGM